MLLIILYGIAVVVGGNNTESSWKLQYNVIIFNFTVNADTVNEQVIIIHTGDH